MKENFLVLETPQWRLIVGYGGEPPNWFHRKMQYLLLGFKWEKV